MKKKIVIGVLSLAIVGSLAFSENWIVTVTCRNCHAEYKETSAGATKEEAIENVKAMFLAKSLHTKKSCAQNKRGYLVGLAKSDAVEKNGK